MSNIDRALLERKLSALDRALARFAEAIEAPLDPKLFMLDASLHRFMFCYELLWKNTKHFLDAYSGIIANSPTSAFRHAYSEGWIAEEHKAALEEAIADRNVITHDYYEMEARAIYEKLPGILLAMKSVANQLSTLLFP